MQIWVARNDRASLSSTSIDDVIETVFIGHLAKVGHSSCLSLACILRDVGADGLKREVGGERRSTPSNSASMAKSPLSPRMFRIP